MPSNKSSYAIPLLFVLLLIGCTKEAPSEALPPDQLYSPAPKIEKQPTRLELNVPTYITIDGDSVEIAGLTEEDAKVRVEGKTVPLSSSGSFSTIISPITSGRHSFKVTAVAPNKEESSKSVTVERPFNELEFNIESEYLGQGEVRATIQTNLWKGTDVDVNIFSISTLNPGHEDDGGIDYSKWYDLYDAKTKNTALNKLDFSDIEYNNTVSISDEGIAETKALLFHPEALKHDFSEIETMQHVYLHDDLLSNSLEKRRVFERDASFVLDFRISRNKLNASNQQVDNLHGMNISDIKLPSGCKLLTYDLYGQQVKEIQCTKRITVARALITADKNKGEEEQQAAIAAKEAKECGILTDRDCYFYFYRSGNVSWQDAYSGCFERGGTLPTKVQATSIREALAEKYASNPQLTFVWTSETMNGDQGIAYGWVEGFRKNAWDEYRSDWATANSDKRDYVTYVCVKKR